MHGVSRAAIVVLVLMGLYISSAAGAYATDNASSLASGNSTLDWICESAGEIKDTLFSVVGIAISISVLLLLGMTAYWIWFDDGIFIQPFTMGCCGEDYNGSAISDLLISELQRIRRIYDPTGYLRPRESWASRMKGTMRDIIEKPLTNAEVPHEVSQRYVQEELSSSVSEVRMPPAMSINMSLAHTMPNININTGPALVSIGQILMFLKTISGNPVNTITGSLQRYGTGIHLVAWIGQSRTGAWKVFREAGEESQIHNEEGLPGMVKDLAFMIAKDISKEKPEARTWHGLKLFTEAMDEYNQYFLIGDDQNLKRSMELCLQAVRSEIGYTNDPAALFHNLGRVYLIRNNYEVAERLFRESIKLKPNEGDVFSGLGFALYKQKKFSDAIIANDRAIKLYEKVVEARWKQPNPYEVSININNDLAGAWNNKGTSLDHNGKYDAAINAFEIALGIKPDYAMAWNNKGITQIHQGNYNEAIRSFDKALEIKHDYAEAWHYKGIVLAHLSEHDEAIKALENALDIKPNNADAWFIKGSSLVHQNKYDEAIDAYEKTMEIEPNFATARENLARAWIGKADALVQQGNYEDAIKALDAALNINPNNAEAWNNKGYLLNKIGKYNEALESANESLKVSPNAKYAWDTKGTALYGLGRYNEALDCHSKSIDFDPSDGEVWHNKGKALKALGRDSEAEVAFSKAKELGYEG